MRRLQKKSVPAHNAPRQEHAAGCVVVRETRREPLFLLVRSRAGFWGIPKGRREKKELSRDTALRELREETGLARFFIMNGFRARYSYVHGEGKEGAHKTVTAYLVKTDNAAVTISREHTAFRWVSYEEAMRMIVFRSARTPIARAYRFLAGGKNMIALQEKVYREAQHIPRGSVASYKDIAKRCGSAPRAVARILANNYDPRVPCHRVVSSSGAILGYNGPGGVKEKEYLLRNEGVVFVCNRNGVSKIARSAYDKKRH